ncbi:MAG: hypothetical protein AAGD38_24420, partial [Acidobacteriota bacterium]
ATGGWSSDRRGFLMPFTMAESGCSPVRGCRHLIAGTYRVWETVEGGIPSDSWEPVSPDLTKGVLGQRSVITDLAFAPTDAQRAVVATLDGNVWLGFGLGQPELGPPTWLDVTDGNAVLPNRPILGVAFDGVGRAYASVGGFDANTPEQPGHVFQLDCADADCVPLWRDKSGNLPDLPMNTILVNPKRPTQVFVGSDQGLYITDDIEVDEPVWYRFDAGLPVAMVFDLAVDYGASTLGVFTRSRGAYVWSLPGGTVFADDFETGDTRVWSSTIPR